MEHIRKALTHNKYPKWALDKVEKRLTKLSGEVSNQADSQGTTGTQPTTNEVKTMGHTLQLGSLWKHQKDLQQVWYTHSWQREQHH